MSAKQFISALIILSFISCEHSSGISDGKKEVLADKGNATIVDITERLSTIDSLKESLVKEQQLRIEIHDNQYDCYNSMEYYLTNTTLCIKNYSEHGDMYDSSYIPEALLDKSLSKSEIQKVEYFMTHFFYDSLRTVYSSGISKACSEQRLININIDWKGKSKNIQIEDCYNKDVAKLFNFINLTSIPFLNQENNQNCCYNNQQIRNCFF